LNVCVESTASDADDQLVVAHRSQQATRLRTALTRDRGRDTKTMRRGIRRFREEGLSYHVRHEIVHEDDVIVVEAMDGLDEFHCLGAVIAESTVKSLPLENHLQHLPIGKHIYK
jgi:hypothetical protein